MRNLCYAFGREAAAGQVFAGDGAFGAAQLLFKPGGGGLVQFEQLAALAGFGGFFGRGELALGQRDAGLLRDDAHGFREADVLNFLHEAEDVAGDLAAEAVVELAHRVDGEGGRFFLVEGAEAGIVLRAGFAQADVALDHLDDVGVLFGELREVGHGWSVTSIRRDAV